LRVPTEFYFTKKTPKSGQPVNYISIINFYKYFLFSTNNSAFSGSDLNHEVMDYLKSLPSNDIYEEEVIFQPTTLCRFIK